MYADKDKKSVRMCYIYLSNVPGTSRRAHLLLKLWYNTSWTESPATAVIEMEEGQC